MLVSEVASLAEEADPLSVEHGAVLRLILVVRSRVGLRVLIFDLELLSAVSVEAAGAEPAVAGSLEPVLA